MCVINDGVTSKLPLCYEDCVATHQQFCYNDWVLIEDKKEKGVFYESRGHFRLPNCDELPRYNRSAKPPTCSYVGLTEMDLDEVTCMIIQMKAKHRSLMDRSEVVNHEHTLYFKIHQILS